MLLSSTNWVRCGTGCCCLRLLPTTTKEPPPTPTTSPPTGDSSAQYASRRRAGTDVWAGQGRKLPESWAECKMLGAHELRTTRDCGRRGGRREGAISLNRANLSGVARSRGEFGEIATGI